MTADFARIAVMPVIPAPRMRAATTASTPRSCPGVNRSAASMRSNRRCPGAAPAGGAVSRGTAGGAGACVGAGGDWTDNYCTSLDRRPAGLWTRSPRARLTWLECRGTPTWYRPAATGGDYRLVAARRAPAAVRWDRAERRRLLHRG